MDGLALWQECKPQTAWDWIEVARDFNEADEDAGSAHPLFQALLIAVADMDDKR